jgi:hypothetical protein
MNNYALINIRLIKCIHETNYSDFVSIILKTLLKILKLLRNILFTIIQSFKMSSINSYPLLTRLVAAAVSVSNKSANILREIKKSGDLNIQEKSANDYVTKADFLSQLNIIKSLENMFPKLKFCGEEGVTFGLLYFDPKTKTNL